MSEVISENNEVTEMSSEHVHRQTMKGRASSKTSRKNLFGKETASKVDEVFTSLLDERDFNFSLQ